MSGEAPNFFILGAPKCGTTSLARWLEQHPQVFMSPIKEPHYYSTDLANRSIQSADRYARLFDGVTEAHRAIGEASTWYLFSQEAVAKIEREHPGGRYIVMTRDPVAMAHSLYHHNRRVLHEDQSTFEAAWRLQEERAAGRHLPVDCTEPAFLQYFAACSLGSLLRRLYEQVPAERVLHVPLEWVQKDPVREYQRVLSHLGVDDDGRENFPPANEARGYRSRVLQRALRFGGRLRLALGINRGLGLGRLNERPREKERLHPEFLQRLESAFAEERALLDAFVEEDMRRNPEVKPRVANREGRRSQPKERS